MIKNDSRPQGVTEPICKKIQNYIFKFADLLGQGNFSKVYKAHHEITNQVYAIKIVQLNSLKSKKLEELLFSEIDILKKLDHPNVLRCFEVFTSNRNCYIITQICNGGDLQTKLRKQHHFSEQAAQPIITDIFQGLLYLSSKNVIHRDLKVANVFLHNGKSKIADFGFAKFTQERFKDINIGSPIYMSPQGLIHNVYGPKTDVWAFGILIYEILHGETPFAHCRTESELKHQIMTPISERRLKPDLSSQIKQIITLCLEIDESKRVTFQKLEQRAYFQKKMPRSPMEQNMPPHEKFSSVASSEYPQPEFYSNRKIMDRNSLFMPHSKNLGLLQGERPGRSSNKMLPLRYSENRQYRNLSVERNIVGVGKTEPLESKNKSAKPLSPIQYQNQSINQNQSVVLPILTFKQCVNLLHYCRLNYKFVTFLKDSTFNWEEYRRFFSEWVIFMMNQLQDKVNDNGIRYDGENAWLREKKLREVTKEYLKKYQSQLIATINSGITLSSVEKYAIAFFEKVDARILSGNPDEKLLVLGHFIVMIIEGTNLIRKCIDQGNCKLIGSSKELENFLGVKRESMDLQSYKILRKKISFIR